MLAPVALFVYNRLWHTQQTVRSLAANQSANQTDLIIFSDGPRRSSNAGQVQEVRDYIRTIRGFKSVQIIESDINKGLAKSVISGVSDVLSRFDNLIVLEDDMVTSPYFLTYMNDGLRRYQSDDAVISIHGYVYPVGNELPETFFLRGADCWGWATWKRGWSLFEPDGRILLHELQQKKLTREFDFDGAYPYTRMLKKQISGKNDSWAIRWYASAFLKNKLTLYPGRSLLQNIGNDASGTHSWNNERFFHSNLAGEVSIGNAPLQENKNVRKVISSYLRSTNPSTGRKIISRLKFLLR